MNGICMRQEINENEKLSELSLAAVGLDHPVAVIRIGVLRWFAKPPKAFPLFWPVKTARLLLPASWGRSYGADDHAIRCLS